MPMCTYSEHKRQDERQGAHGSMGGEVSGIPRTFYTPTHIQEEPYHKEVQYVALLSQPLRPCFKGNACVLCSPIAYSMHIHVFGAHSWRRTDVSRLVQA